MKRAKLLKYLKENGCDFFKEGTNHTIFINRKTNNLSTIPRHNDINDILAAKICKDLNVPKFNSH
jgi:predicted RNA binding protein YcfA (HicA-like mRNA interferase family)